LSILLVLLTAFLTPISILSTWTAVEDRVKDFMIFFLLLEVGMMGVFLAQDLFLFYIFWEFTLVPMYFLIGIWGGPRHLGRTTSYLRRHQVLPLHNGWLHFDAACHPVARYLWTDFLSAGIDRAA
jgi:hypothetical protein